MFKIIISYFRISLLRTVFPGGAVLCISVYNIFQCSVNYLRDEINPGHSVGSPELEHCGLLNETK